MRKLRVMLVLIGVAFGLVAQGFGMPAMASDSNDLGPTQCQMLAGDCSSPGQTHSMPASACQLPCVTPAALPGPMLAAMPVHWTTLRFSPAKLGLVAGLSRAPDPFPPRV